MSNITVEYFTRVNSPHEPDVWAKCEIEFAEWEVWYESGEFAQCQYVFPDTPEDPITDFAKIPTYLKKILNSSQKKVFTNLTEALSHTRLLIDKGVYEKEIEEPTPLDKKCLLVNEVKEMFVEDLLSQGVHVESITLAWDIAEAEIGADEALNKGFLYSVLNYIQDLEEYFIKRSRNSSENHHLINWKTPIGDNLSELF